MNTYGTERKMNCNDTLSWDLDTEDWREKQDI